MTWQTYLDEIARVGYVYTELGPSGFLPQDPNRLREELGSPGLTVSGGTVFAGLHRGKEALDEAVSRFDEAAVLGQLRALVPEFVDAPAAAGLPEPPGAAGSAERGGR